MDQSVANFHGELIKNAQNLFKLSVGFSTTLIGVVIGSAQAGLVAGDGYPAKMKSNTYIVTC